MTYRSVLNNLPRNLAGEVGHEFVDRIERGGSVDDLMEMVIMDKFCEGFMYNVFEGENYGSISVETQR